MLSPFADLELVGAFISFTCLNGTVRGITSARNFRLSWYATALAKAGSARTRNLQIHESYKGPGIGYSGVVFVLI